MIINIYSCTFYDYLLTSPLTESGLLTTAASATASCSISALSTSNGPIRKQPPPPPPPPPPPHPHPCYDHLHERSLFTTFSESNSVSIQGPFDL